MPESNPSRFTSGPSTVRFHYQVQPEQELERHSICLRGQLFEEEDGSVLRDQPDSLSTCLGTAICDARVPFE